MFYLILYKTQESLPSHPSNHLSVLHLQFSALFENKLKKEGSGNGTEVQPWQVQVDIMFLRNKAMLESIMLNISRNF